MINSKILTIEEHEKIVGNRFTLTHILIKRTKELMNGAALRKGLSDEFKPRNRHEEIPNHRMPKIAMEELRLGKLQWSNPSNDKPEPEISEIVQSNNVVFGE